MRSWRPATGGGALLIVGSLLTGLLPPSAQARWELSAAAAGGHEDREVLEPGPVPATLPGGLFADLLLEADARLRLGTDRSLRLQGRGWMERFEGEERRLLLSQWIAAGLDQSLARRWRLRTTVEGSFLDDSALDSRRRWTAGGELALGRDGRRWSLEAAVAGGLRRQPDLTVADGTGAPVSYRETRWDLGLVAALRPHPSWILRVEGRRQTTDANDPAWDARSWILGASVRWRLGGGLSAVGQVLGQWRDFPERESLQEDRYGRWGAGLDLALGSRTWAEVRFVQSGYRWPGGQDDRSDRVTVGLRWTFARSAPTLPPPTDLPSAPPGGPSPLRLHAPAAQRVSVVGDFNGWRPGATPLERSGGGWWSVQLDLAPGRYLYAFVVDGEILAPPEADILVDDGFGGRNGLLLVDG